MPLQVDGNAAYTLADAGVLRRLDAFDLLLIEQPLAEDDIRQHAELARLIRTPICLDESVVSVRAAADAIASASRRPRAPIATFEQPLFTTTPRARPARTRARESSTGATPFSTPSFHAAA